MKQKSTRDAFGEELIKQAKRDLRIVVVSADLASSVRVSLFAQKYPNRFCELGVAEQNAAGVAAGLALGGRIPFLVTYACFSPALNWGQIRQSVCLNNANVKIVGSHGGLATGADGATHQALEDIALMRVIPNMKIFTPLDFNETKKIVRSMIKDEGPCYLRLTKPETVIYPSHSFEIGQSQVLKRGTRATLIGYGPILAETISYFEKELTGIEIINCPTLKPLEAENIIRSIEKTRKVITLEDHQITGGLGSLVAEIIAENKINAKLTRIGMNDQFGESARNYKELWEKYLWGPLKETLGQI